MEIIIIEDHPFILNTYINLIEKVKNKDDKLNFISAHNCEEALLKINSQKNMNKKLNIALVDINIPAYKSLNSGIDIVILIKKLYADCKIIILTAFTNPLLIYNLNKKINIEAIVCKSDMNYTLFFNLYNILISGQTYRSKTVQQEFRLITKHTLGLDEIDINLLHLLSKGIKTKDLPQYIPLKLSAIEKRKSYLKYHFSTRTDNNNSTFIEKAYELGILEKP